MLLHSIYSMCMMIAEHCLHLAAMLQTFPTQALRQIRALLTERQSWNDTRQRDGRSQALKRKICNTDELLVAT